MAFTDPLTGAIDVAEGAPGVQARCRKAREPPPCGVFREKVVFS
jgi:hypothetical protein